MKLPIKTRILQWAIEENRQFTGKECIEVMQKEYAGEKISSEAWVEKQLEAYTRVNVLKAENVELENNDQLVVTYSVTDIGKTYTKYFPK